MSQEVAETDLDHYTVGGGSTGQPPAAFQDSTSIVPSTHSLAIPTRSIPHGQISFGSREVWLPQYIHTAKCDRCGQHNTSVIQRSSCENKQFCKPCMHLNISDGIYTVNIEGLDWTPQHVSTKRTTKPRKPKQSKKAPAITPSPTRVSKRKLREPRLSANKRVRLAEQPDRESWGDDSLFVPENEARDEGEETDDNIGFGQLPQGTPFSSDGRVTASTKPTSIAETIESTRFADEDGEGLENRKEKETEHHSAYSVNKPEHPPWWEQAQAGEGSVRAEPRESLWDSNVHFSLIERRRSEFSPEAVAAANILLMLSQDPRGS